MPVLPSGIEVEFGVELLDELLRQSGPERDEQVMSFERWPALIGFLTWRRVIRDLAMAPPELVPIAGKVARDEELPGLVYGLERWDLSECKGSSTWSDEDLAAIRKLHQGQPYLNMLSRSAWERVVAAQREITKCRAEPETPISALEGDARNEPLTPHNAQPGAPKRLARQDEQAQARTKREQEEARIRAAIGFSLDDLEQHHYGVARTAVTASNRLLVGGRECRIGDLVQWSTYGGLLCGRPSEPMHHLMRAVERAKELFPWYARTPHVVPPLLRVGRTGLNGWQMLPPVTTIAVLEDEQQAVVVWYQDRYGLDLPDRVYRGLAQMDWTQHGVDTDF